MSNVLIYFPDAHLREAVMQFLLQEGYVVQSAHNRDSFLEACENGDLDAIITHWDGVGLCVTAPLRQDSSTVVVVYTADYNNANEKLRQLGLSGEPNVHVVDNNTMLAALMILIKGYLGEWRLRSKATVL